MTGLLLAVVGPSGAGKDTLIAALRDRIGGDGGVVFARRTVTRKDGGPEDHDTMSPETFATAEGSGDFALTWRAHGLCYGLPAGLLADVTAGRMVIANLSRRVLDAAEGRFGRLAVVSVNVAPSILVQRITARGRETREETLARLARTHPPLATSATRPLFHLDNSGDLACGAKQLKAIVDTLRAGV